MTSDENNPGTNNFFDSLFEAKEKQASGVQKLFNEPEAYENMSQEELLQSVDEKTEEQQTTNDYSRMPHEARRVLVYLMRQGVIIAKQKPKLFEQLCRYESHLRQHLSEVYLQLVLDIKAGLAFVASFNSEHIEKDLEETEDVEFSTLIPRRTLSLYDTLLLLVLRKYYQDKETAGEQKIIIDLDQIESHLRPFLPLTEHAGLDRKRLIARVKEMIKRKVLATQRSAEQRYEITPIIRYVVNAEFLESMLDEYQRMATQAGIEVQAKEQSVQDNELGIQSNSLLD